MKITQKDDEISITFKPDAALEVYSILSFILKAKMDSCDSLVLFNSHVAEFGDALSTYFEHLGGRNELPIDMKGTGDDSQRYHLVDEFQVDGMQSFFIDALKRSERVQEWLDAKKSEKENFVRYFYSPILISKKQIEDIIMNVTEELE